MNLQETVNYQLKIFGAIWYPVLDMLKVGPSMLGADSCLTQYSRVSTAKNILLLFDQEVVPKRILLNELCKNTTFLSDIAELKLNGHFAHDYHDERMQMLHCFDDGLAWLQLAGMCCSLQAKDCLEADVKLLTVGKDVTRLLKHEKEFCDAAAFLTVDGTSRYMSETEEHVNCVLVGHEEWTEASWLEPQLQWLRAVEALCGNDPIDPSGRRNGLGTRLTKKLVQLQLVKSWEKLVNGSA